MLIVTTPFFWATLILFATSIVFYIVCVSLLYYWHEKRATFIILPLLYTFEFFTVGFLIISIIVIILQYLPDILNLTH